MTWATLLTILSYGGWLVAGGLGIVGMFDGASRRRRQEDDSTASNLITNLRTTTDLQEKEIIQLRTKEIEQGKQIAHLEGQVKTLTEIMQGRDPSMSSFFKEAPTLIALVKENSEHARAAADSMTLLTNAITKLVVTFTPPTGKQLM